MSIIIACGSRKLPRPAKAKDIYTGALFRGARQAAEATGEPWFIMSAKYGLLHPDTTIEPYNMTYGKTSGAPPSMIARQVQELAIPLPVWALVPARYADVLKKAIGPGNVRQPLKGLSMGFQNRAFKNIRIARSVEAGLRLSNVPHQ